MITATGLGSGLDVGSLVAQLVASERSVSDIQLTRQETNLTSKFSALGSLKGSLGGFKATVSGLNTLSSFSTNKATSSDTSVFTATADADALSSDYSIEVSQLAKSHSLASVGFADSDETVVGTGTITIRRGTTDYEPGTDTYSSFTLNSESTTTDITIDSSNNTLEGVMTAINDADAGISASIINDGSGFRLLLASDITGEENSLEIAVSDDDANDTDTSGLSQLTFNASSTNLEQTAEALDANFTINGLAITSADNSVTSAIPGVTFNLLQTSASPVTLSVSADLTPVLSGVNSLIAGFNSYINTANSLSSYDVEGDVAAPLVGDFTLRSISGQVNSILRNAVAGLTGDFTNLSEIGITTTVTGTLVLDSDVLTAALNDNPQQVAKMFAAVGAPDNENIEFNSSSSATAVGNYEVNILSLPTSGVLDGDAVLPNFGFPLVSLDIDSDNDNLTFEIDGITLSEITLTSGSYTTGDDLAAELQAQINATTEMVEASRTVSVVYDAGGSRFTITSDSTGSDSAVNVLAVDTNTAAELGFTVGSGVPGSDIVATINGESATTVGNVLVGDEGTAAEGLSLILNGTSTGSQGFVNFTRGIANQLDELLDDILTDDGALESRIDTLQDRIDDVATRREDLELRWAEVEERYTRQFNALDSLLASLENTSSYLELQFENLLKPNVNN